MSNIQIEAQFLIERLRQFESENLDQSSFRDWNGHVSPSIARLEQILEAARAQGAEAVEFGSGDKVKATVHQLREIANSLSNGYAVEPSDADAVKAMDDAAKLLTTPPTTGTGGVPDGKLRKAILELDPDDDMFGIDFQDEMISYTCNYCEFEAYDTDDPEIVHDDACPILRLRALLSTTPGSEWVSFELGHPEGDVVWYWDDYQGVMLVSAEQAVKRGLQSKAHNPHWMPTGLKRPEPPVQGGK